MNSTEKHMDRVDDKVFEGSVIALAFGGQGIIRLEGMVIFLPFTAIGDVVRFRIAKRKKNFAYGEVIAVISPSPARATPLCPYFGVCGGCQIQHLNASAQLDYKKQSILDAFKRIAQIDVEIPNVIPSSDLWAYRRKITLNLSPKDKGFCAGYIATDGHSLVEINKCPIFVSSDNGVISEFQKELNKLSNQREQSGRASIIKNNDRFIFLLQFDEIPENCQEVFSEAFQKYPQWQGILVKSRKAALSFGDTATELHINKASFSFAPEAFIQANAEQSQNIYQSIISHALNFKPNIVFDLYCGIGISTILLAQKKLRTIGIEGHPEAVKHGMLNLKRNGVENAEILCSDVKHALPNLLKTHRPELVIVNPPRTGLEAAVIDMLLKAALKKIIYISCMPPTMARDLKLLSKGYTVEKVEAYDMFPQTSHVETLVVLSHH